MHKWLFIVLFTVLLVYCKKDDPVNSVCQEIPLPPAGLGYNIVNLDQFGVGPACFNPNKEEEFVCYGVIDSIGHYGLLICNLTSNFKRVIYEKDIYFQPKWGVNDWILFNGHDNQIWKIKSNGDSLTQLTFNGGNSSPEWNKNATRIIWRNAHLQKYIIAEPNGTPVDTIDFGGGNVPCWQHDSLISGVGPSWAFVTNTVKDTFEFTYEYTPTGFYSSAQWIDNERFIWSYEKGIYISNYLTNETEEIKSLCNSVFYLYPTFSPISKKVMFSVVKRKVIDENTLGITTNYGIMNIDGSDERIISFR